MGSSIDNAPQAPQEQRAPISHAAPGAQAAVTDCAAPGGQTAWPVRPARKCKRPPRPGTGRRGLWAAGLALLFAAAFLLGAGAMQLLLERQQEARRMPTVLEGEQVGEELDASLSGVGVAGELKADAAGHCLARIENKPENANSARVQIMRTATGEVLYESGLIDPGHYVEYIDLNTRLREGWYPCRVTWEFYDPATLEPVGKAAQSAVLIVTDQSV